MKPKQATSELTKRQRFELDIVAALETGLDCSTSDAQSILEASGAFYVAQGWAGGASPADVAAKIIASGSKAKNSGSRSLTYAYPFSTAAEKHGRKTQGCYVLAINHHEYAIDSPRMAVLRFEEYNHLSIAHNSFFGRFDSDETRRERMLTP